MTGLAKRTAIPILAACLAACSSSTGPGSIRVPTPIASPSEVTLPDSVLGLYRDDAARLAVRLQVVSPDSDQVVIPANVLTSILNALLQVATNPSVRDVSPASWIHTFPNPSVHELSAGVDTSAPWLKRLEETDSLSGNATFDSLLVQWNLSVRTIFEWSWGYHSVLLFSPTPLNLSALAKNFGALEYVRWSREETYAGDGSDIDARDLVGKWELTYRLAWGDCPAGCTAAHFWQYFVYPEGTVEFVAEWGTPLDGS